MASDRGTVVDLSLSPPYRKGHIPGAWFAIRTRLAEALAKIPMNGELVLTSEDGVLAGLALAEATALTTRVRYLRGGNAAWQAPASRCRPSRAWPTSRWTIGPSPTSAPATPRGAMNEYLSWEVDLLPRIERDGTCRFAIAPKRGPA